ncbi:MAG: class I mannose-6-phosphate isomerase [Clostridia bacterium]|nr:class I mannose-6-phosphate isomerase [Clostridia bacterium]
MNYPLLFKPLYKDYIWGGRRLESFGKELPAGITAESWEIACHPAGTGVVSVGPLKGKSLQELIDEYKELLLGTELYKDSNNKFPLLIKLIDASKDLSVQVHPDDEYAFINENGELGKNEMWYVVDALPGTKLVSGIKAQITKEVFEEAVKEGTVEECLNFVEVQPGDCFNIPAGLIHAIGAGNLICEIQQNSNTTYRVYDYNRTDDQGNKRPLHVEKALEVIDFSKRKKIHYTGITIENDSLKRTFLVANEYFAVEKITFDGSFEENTEGERFHCFTVLDGSLEFNGVKVTKAHSCLIPAAAGKYTVSGKGTAIKSYVPDLQKNVMFPLMDAGYSIQEIEESIR